VTYHVNDKRRNVIYHVIVNGRLPASQITGERRAQVPPGAQRGTVLPGDLGDSAGDLVDGLRRRISACSRLAWAGGISGHDASGTAYVGLGGFPGGVEERGGGPP
jgi:hypothetical protein